MSRTLVVLLMASLCLGCPKSTDESSEETSEEDDRRRKRDRERDPERDERRLKRELLTWIKDKQHGLFIKGDEKSYFGIYTKEGRIISARAEADGPYDYFVPVARSLAFIKVRPAVSPTKGYEQSYTDEAIEIDGDNATIRWIVSAEWPTTGGKATMKVGERYRLVRKTKRWKVAEKRGWFISGSSPPAPESLNKQRRMFVYDAAWWEDRDADVRSRQNIGGGELFWALIHANRMPEAYQLAKRATQGAYADAGWFYLWGHGAARLHFGDETKEAFATATRLDPRLVAPEPWGPPPPPGADKKKKDERAPITDWMRRASTL